MAAWLPTPRYCMQHCRFTKQDGWRLWDISVQLYGNIAVSCGNKNTKQISIDVYSVRNSDSRDKPKIFYSKQFEKYKTEDGRKHWGQRVSFVDSYDDNRGLVIATGIGDKLELFDLIQDRVLKSRKITLINHGGIKCLSVREREIFIGFYQSNKITVYDVIDLNEIKSIILQGIQDGHWPYDMTAIADRIFVCVGDIKEESVRRSLIFDEKNGRILSELTKPTDTHWYTNNITMCVTLGVVAVVWYDSYYKKKGERWQTVFYSLFSENYSSFLIVEIESGISSIRISDRGHRMVTGNWRTGEVKVYDMAEIFTYSHLKASLTSQLKSDDCWKLTNFFALPQDQTAAISKSDTPTDNLLIALEEKGLIQPSNVDKLVEAFTELEISSSCYNVTYIYQMTRGQATLYGKFLATLSAHLTASLPEDLCDYFNIPDEKKSSITSTQNPGLSLLLALDELEVIKPFEVVALELPFSQFQLVQAKAKVEEYQVQVREENAWSQRMPNQTMEDKVEVFVQCLQNKIKGWYETMTPVPWKKSCRWRSSDLFVGSGLILTHSKAKTNTADIDPQCKLEYQDALTHDRLKSEKRLILEGEPGSGKTMLSSQLAYDWAQGKFKDIQILVFLQLKFVEGRKLVFAMRKFYVSEKIPLSEEDIEAVLNRDDLSTVILLDGLEEYNSPVTKAKGKPSEVHEIMAKIKYPSCKVVLTSRSDYAHDLPTCPMLKLGKFGEGERDTYIERVFKEDKVKQLEIKRVIEDTPFIMELCSVPLLFVLAVHHIKRIAKLQEGQIDRVTPFMDGMVETLCPPFYYKDRTHTVELEEYKLGGFTIEELAFSGLCKGFQQLSWPKDFMMTNVDNIKDWIDSGVLVVEEEIANVAKDELLINKQLEEKPGETVKEAEEGNVPSISGVLKEGKNSANIEYGAASKKTMFYSESDSKQDSEKDSQSDSEEEAKQTSSGSTAQIVALRIKFLHKVFQEWFAAKYLSSVIWFKKKSSFSEHLASINPVDLHYILRFTCYLCPPSCHIVLNHLMNSYCSSEGIIPKHIMDCICLCYTEYDGYMGDDIKTAVSEICKETMTIQSMDSRLLQQSKIVMLKFASQSGIPIMKVQLLDVVATVGDERLTFNSGVTLEVLHTLRMIEISRWDQKLKEEDYRNLVNFIAKSQSTKSAYLSFPSQPPILLQNTLDEIATKDIAVHWQIGQLVQTLDPSKKLWTIHLRGHQMTPKSPLEIGADSSTEQSKEPSTSASLPGISGISTSTQTKQETLKQHGTDFSQLTREIPVFEKRIKVDSTEEEESLIESFQKGESQDSSIEQSREPSTSPSLPGISGLSTSTQTKQETLKRYGTEFSQLTSETPVFEKRRKVDSTEEEESLVECFQQGESQDDNTDTVDDLYKEGFIDEHGGTLFLREADISLHIPAGALSCCCLIRIIVPMNLGSIFTDSQVSHRVTPLTICEPDKLLFKTPVKLTLPHCAVIKTPGDHKVNVKFGYKDDNTKEMIWKSEAVDSSLGEHYYSVFLYHFTGVDVGISSTEEKILRVIPYTKLRRNNQLFLNIWLCNDVESDFQSVMQTEENSAGIPLDSYDTFQLNFVSGPGKSNVKVKLEGLQGNSWHFEKSEDTIHVDRLSDKSKSSFMLQGPDADGGESYMYLILKITQTVALEERDTTFVVRKMIRDLKTPVMFQKPCCQYEHVTNHLLPTEKQRTRTYTAVVYMDPGKDREDDAILTLWLSPFRSTSDMFQSLQKEQELQFRHRVDTENSFLVFNDKVAVISKTRFLNGKWILSPEEKKIETDRIRFGSRAKFQFIGRRKEHVDTDYIDLEVEVFQEEENKLKFMSDVEMDDLLYEIRRRKRQESTASASKEPATASREVQTIGQHQLATISLPVTNTTHRMSIDHAASGNAPLSQSKKNTGVLEERLRKCFLCLKRNLTGDWKDFGRYLNLSEGELNRLSKEYKDDIGESIYQMLLSWQRQNGSEATPIKLMEELENLGRKDLAEKLEKC